MLVEPSQSSFHSSDLKLLEIYTVLLVLMKARPTILPSSICVSILTVTLV